MSLITYFYLPEPEPTTPMNGKNTADWLVIGAGFAGLAAAHRLVKQAKGNKIVVLDAVRVGDGPAGRNSGFMIDLPHDLTSADYGGALDADVAQTQDNRLGIAHACEMAAEYGIKLHWIRWDRLGTICSDCAAWRDWIRLGQME